MRNPDAPPALLGVISARGGSKSIPRKNIVDLAGKPLIAWTIEAALSSGVVDRLIVSTEDAEIAETARRYEAEVPFLRPAKLARDDTPGIEPVLHAVRWLEEHEGYRPAWVMLLQPTSPFRSADDIRAAVGMMCERGADAVVSVCEVEHHPYWVKRLCEGGRLATLVSLEGAYPSRQDLPSAVALNGAIYLIRRDVLLAQQTFYTERTYGYVMPRERSLDIDTPWDLYLAQLIARDRTQHARG